MRLFNLIMLSSYVTFMFAQLEIPRLDSEAGLKQSFLLVCDTSPDKIILLDDNGKWIHSAREVEISISNGSSVVKCMMYEGQYRPTSPTVKSWKLSQVKTLSESEFQSMINSLQADPEAVKKSLKSPENQAQPAPTQAQPQ